MKPLPLLLSALFTTLLPALVVAQPPANPTSHPTHEVTPPQQDNAAQDTTSTSSEELDRMTTPELHAKLRAMRCKPRHLHQARLELDRQARRFHAALEALARAERESKQMLRERVRHDEGESLARSAALTARHLKELAARKRKGTAALEKLERARQELDQRATQAYLDCQMERVLDADVPDFSALEAQLPKMPGKQDSGNRPLSKQELEDGQKLLELLATTHDDNE